MLFRKLVLAVALILLSITLSAVSCKEKFHHGVIYINPGGYDALTDSIKNFLASADPQDTKLSRHIVVKEATDGERIETHKLQFIGNDGEAKETVLVDHIPLGMVKDLIKEKEFSWPDNGVEKDDL